ncbi:MULTISPECIES: TonB-dependent receptor [unclassified Helicobacter]|uniref:TonB-dependent receptor n=1 Tax=unclassified Helicobacter TaxID=2593540 RepID=UPI000CF0DD6B|nr:MULTISPECIES: TonB-dependent receptor plug domain-containing protein [unclassified Helicobacter]
MDIEKLTTKSLRLSFVCVALLSFYNLKAQETKQEENNDATFNLTTISTTAAKTQREIFYTPDNIASISGESLQNLNITNSKNLQNVFSGLYIGDSGGSAYPQITLRGFHSGYYYNSSVRLYIDGVPQDIFFLNQELLDVESVELFKGYAGTLYGQNAQAGILSIISNTISDQTKVKGEINFGNLNRGISATASGAIIPHKLYTKISFKHQEFLGQIKDSSTGKLADTTESNLGRFSLIYNEELWNLGFDYYIDKSKFRDIFYLTDNEINSLEHDFGSSGIPLIDRTVQTYALRGGFDTERFSLSNVFSVQDRTMPITSFGSTWQEDNQTFNNELKFTQTYSNNSTSLYGFFVSYSNFKHQFLRDNTREGDTNKLQSLHLALFSDHHILLKHNFDINIGLRYQYDRSLINYNKGTNATSTINSFDSRFDSHNLAGRIAASYTLFGNHKFYTQVSRGFKEGGFPGAIFYQGYENAFKPETNYMAEIGYKGFFLGDKIYINADYYFGYTKNRQENILIDANANNYIVGNVGNMLTHGFEFEGKYQFLKESFIMLNFAYINAKYHNAINPYTGAKLESNVFFVPSFNINASLDTIIWGNNVIKIFFNTGISYKSTILLSSDFKQKPYTLWDLGLRAEYKSLSLAFQVNNVLNTIYDTYGYVVGDTKYHQIGRTRSFNIILSAKF